MVQHPDHPREDDHVQPQARTAETLESLLRNAASWHRAAHARELQPALMVARARIQAALRQLTPLPGDAGILDELTQISDHLRDLVIGLGASDLPGQGRRQRLQPEAEIAGVLGLVGVEPHSTRAIAGPRVTAVPGLIGHTVLQSVLSRRPARTCQVALDRPLAGVLSVIIEGPPPPRDVGTALHLQAARLGIDQLGGRLECREQAVTRLEIPLEL